MRTDSLRTDSMLSAGASEDELLSGSGSDLEGAGSSADEEEDQRRGACGARRRQRWHVLLGLATVCCAALFAAAASGLVGSGGDTTPIGTKRAEVVPEAAPTKIPANPPLEQAWNPFIVELEAQSNTMCNNKTKSPGPVKPRKFVLNAEWDNKCANLPHQGHWEPPKEWGADAERNWCWVYVKEQAQQHRFDKTQHFKPPNWWFCQEEAAKQGHAPDPWALNLYPLINHEICDRTSNGDWHLPKWVDWDGDEGGGALHWFNKYVDVYVINMPSNTKRLETISEHMKSLNIPFTRVNGISLTKPGELEAAVKQGLVPADWSSEDAQAANKKQYVGSATGYNKDALGETGLGTAGCTAAHLNAMKTASQSSKPLALILEDDVKLENQFLPKVKRLVYEEAPCDWEAINLLLYMAFGECVTQHLARVHPDGNEPEEVCHKGVNWSFGAVLYKVSQLQKIHEELWRVTWNASQPTCIVHDIAFASISDKINYYGVPAQQYPGLASIFQNSGSDRVAGN